MTKIKKIMVIASHPDDEVLGCGGTLIKYSKLGYEIKIIFMTNGVSSRSNYKKKEIKIRKLSAIKAGKILGAKKIKFFNFKDNAMDTVSLITIVKKLEKEIKYYKPDIVYTHFYGDLNIDHEITSRAVMTACRPINKLSIEKIFLFYIPSSTEWRLDRKNKNYIPNWFEDISKNKIEKKLALKCYKTEMREWPHPRSIKNIENLQKVFGSEVGQKSTETFILYRGLN